ncbi:MAG: hypothetical protein JO201_08885, partial [Verrucomicrobia bacterium]|nr:hypothetical protein [Verrucomicrobiota bacterium]
MAQGSLNQLSSVEINHVVADKVSTLQRKTAVATPRLQPIFVVTAVVGSRSRVNEMGSQSMKTNMKRNLLTFATAGAIALGGFAWVNAQDGGGGFGGHQGGWCEHQFGMEHLAKSLNLTADQQTKVQPLLDQARPQIIAIHKDAMQKTQAILDKTMSQIRPI